MGEQQVVTGVEFVRLGQAEIRTQEIGHGAVAEPLAMQPPLAARFNQPVSDQDLQNLVPTRSLPARRQALGPEPIEMQVTPQQPGQPTGAPLPRTMQAKFGQAEPHQRGIVRYSLATILREQRQRLRASAIRIENLDRPTPNFRLRRIDLTQIQNVPLHHPAAIETLVLDDVPIEVGLTVLPSLDSSQEHDDAG